MTYCKTIKIWQRILLPFFVYGLCSFFPVFAMEKGLLFYGVDIKQLERRWGKDTESNAWSLRGDIGYDEWKVKLLSKGNFETRQAKYKRLEHQLLMYMPISEFFDVKAGGLANRPDKKPQRDYAVIGLEGLAKQWVEIDFTLFYNDKSGVSGLADFDYELHFTPSVLLVSNIEAKYAEKDDEKAGIYKGWRSVELGMRLHYGMTWQRLSLYAGYIAERSLGRTAHLKELAGEPLTESFALAGLSLSF